MALAAPLPVKDRPKCWFCKKPLRPRVTHNWKGLEIVSRHFWGVYGENNSFCGPLHATKWAIQIVAGIKNGRYKLVEGRS